jgi:hypothetical protein
MSSISIETSNENKFRVEEYVRFVRIRDSIQEILNNTSIKETMSEAEGSINGLTIDVIVKISLNR